MMLLSSSNQIFGTIPSIQQLASVSISRITSFLPPSSGRRLFSTAWSSEEEVERLPNEDTPWLMLKPEIDGATGDKLERFYSPGENRMVKMNRNKCLKTSNSAVCVASTLGGWLGYVDPYDCAVSLSNPYLNKVVQLPSITTLPSVLDVKHDRETGAVISLKMEESGPFRSNRFFWSQPTYLTRNIVARMFTNMALSSSESVVAGIQGQVANRRLVYCPISKAFNHSGYGGNDNADSNTNSPPASLEWLGLQEDFNPGYSFHQTVYSSMTNLFYTIFAREGIQAYDLENDRKKRSKVVLDFPMDSIEYFLKEAADERKNAKLEAATKTASHYYYLCPLDDGDLLLLVRHVNKMKSSVTPYETLHFDVFKVDFDGESLERVDELGNYSLFVGSNQSFSMVADKLPGMRTNCIYFSDDQSKHLTCNWGYDHGIFDLRDNNVHPLGYVDRERLPFSEDYSQFWVAPRVLFT